MEEDETQRAARKKSHARLDAACAIVMAISTLATAWCSYQNSGWSGRTSVLEASADGLERKVMEMTLESRQFQAAHLELARKATDALVTGNESWPDSIRIALPLS